LPTLQEAAEERPHSRRQVEGPAPPYAWEG
jgi:hypothetical protein